MNEVLNISKKTVESESGVNIRKKWLKHVSLGSSLIIILYLVLFNFYNSIFSRVIVSTLKISNIFLIFFFALFTIISVLYSNKVRTENLFKEKHINFGLYIFLAGILLINSLLLYLAFEDHPFIFTIINPYILLFIGITLILSGLYSNYTTLDENIYNFVFLNKNYSLRIIATIFFITVYFLFNTPFGFLYFGLIVIFWIDLIVLKVIIPVIVYIATAIYDISRAIVFFVVLLPGRIIRGIISISKRIYFFFVNLSKSSYTKTKTLNGRLHFSQINLLTVVLLSIGLALLITQYSFIFLVFDVLAIFLCYSSLQSLNSLYSDLHYYDSDSEFKKTYFYKLYGSYFIILTFLLEPFVFLIQTYFKITSSTVLSIGIVFIFMALAILFISPIKNLIYATIKAFVYLFNLTKSYFNELQYLINYDIITSSKLIITSLGLILLGYHINLSFYYFFSIFLFLFFIIVATRKDPVIIAFHQTSYEYSNEDKQYLLSNAIKVYLFLSISLVLSLLFFIILLFPTPIHDLIASPYTFYISIVLILGPFTKEILTIGKKVVIALTEYILKILSYFKLNIVTKLIFTYKINIEYGIFTKNQLLKLALNAFFGLLLIQIIFYPIITILFLSIAIDVILLIAYFSTLNNYYNNVFSLIKLSDTATESKVNYSFLQRIKNFLFEDEQDPNKVFNHLVRYKSEIRTIFIIPMFILSNITLLTISNLIVEQELVIILLLLLVLMVINSILMINLFKQGIIWLSNLFKLLAVVSYNFGKGIIVSIIEFVKEIYYLIVQIIRKIYYFTFQNGNKTLSLDLALVLLFIFSIGQLFFSHATQYAVLYDLNVLLLVYVFGLILIWHEIIWYYISSVAMYIYSIIRSITISVYTALVKRGQYSYSLDLLLILLVLIIGSDLTLGYDFTRTIIFIGLLIVGLLIIWLPQEVKLVSKLLSVLVSGIQKALSIGKIAFQKLMLSIKYFFVMSVNWSLFYLAILFSAIFVLFGAIYVISGILNDSGAFVSSLFFDINLLLGLAKVNNIILLLLGGGLVFAGLLLIRIINENKERLFMPIFILPKNKKGFEDYEVHR